MVLNRKVKNLFLRAHAINTRPRKIILTIFQDSSEIYLVTPIILNLHSCQFWTVFRSCAEVKASGYSSDGHYLLHISDRCKDPTRIYCHNMASNEPQEYITLESGAENNFAIIYNQRLKNRYSCSGPARSELYAEQGSTNFFKVRLDIASMKIMSRDFTFALTVEGKDIPYGTAGDCYSVNTGKCRKGQFKVDLSGTRLRVRDDVSWTLQGFPNGLQIQDYQKSLDGAVVSAKCGGWCGRCKPTRGFILVEPLCSIPAGRQQVQVV